MAKPWFIFFQDFLFCNFDISVLQAVKSCRMQARSDRPGRHFVCSDTICSHSFFPYDLNDLKNLPRRSCMAAEAFLFGLSPRNEMFQITRVGLSFTFFSFFFILNTSVVILPDLIQVYDIPQ